MKHILSCPSDRLHVEITGLLLKHFGITSPKEWQLVIIKTVLEGRNSFVLQPTGSGKSICFQLPPLVTGKATVVLTPTISLMNDQCNKLEKCKILTTFLGSSQVIHDVEQKISEGAFQVIYVTPEKFFDDTGTPSKLFKELIHSGQVGLIAIDEVHLVRSWKSFRLVLIIVF